MRRNTEERNPYDDVMETMDELGAGNAGNSKALTEPGEIKVGSETTGLNSYNHISSRLCSLSSTL